MFFKPLLCYFFLRQGEYRDHFSVTEARQLLESDMVITFGLNDILRSSGEPMEGRKRVSLNLIEPCY